MVIAVIARVTGGRADSWDTAVPGCTCSARDPHQASGVHASLPYASAVQTWSMPSRSAMTNSSAAPGGGPELQYPALTAILITPGYRDGGGCRRPPGRAPERG